MYVAITMATAFVYEYKTRILPTLMNQKEMSGNKPLTASRGNSANTTNENPVEDENTWVFESLVGFLTSINWTIPIEDFIENKSMVFEPDEDNHEEYHKIHEEYKYTVDSMLFGFMQDLGITPEQFSKACNDAKVDIKRYKLKQTIFEEIWAAEDYDLFLKMMIERNAVFQLQALEYFNTYKGHENKTKSSDDDNELQEAIRLSFEEHQKSNFETDRETEVLEKIKRDTKDEEQHRLEAEETRDAKLLEQAIKLSLNETTEEIPTNTLDEGTVFYKSEDQAHLSKNVLPKVSDEPALKEDTDNLSNKDASSVDIETRRAYLLEQRDKLLARKHQEHKDQLREETNVRKCPSSARLARNILEKSDTSRNGNNSEVLAARRALAAKLRTEVVGKK